ILDEEGRCIEGMEESIKYQYPIAGIEQTRGGLYSPSLIHTPFPVINVAFSAAKKHLESPFAAKAILKKIEQIIQEDAENNKGAITFVIIGFGNVGKEIA